MTTKNHTKVQRGLNEIVARIAAEILSIETLETRRRDCLDFHDVSVWSVKKALERAYQAGFEAAANAK